MKVFSCHWPSSKQLIIDKNEINPNISRSYFDFILRPGAPPLFNLAKIVEKPSLDMLVTISGWLSQNDCPKRSWDYLLSATSTSEIYNLMWESSSIEMLALKLVKPGIKIASDAITKNLRELLMSVTRLIMNNPFKEARANAKCAGLQLANLIAKNDYCQSRPISLIGFSLGCRIIYKCLKELSNKKVYVHNVFLLGGAVNGKLGKWEKCKGAVLGRFVNVYSEKDYILKFLYPILTFEMPLGIKRLDIEGVENFDVSNISPGHFDYRQNLDAILLHIDYA